MYAVILSLIAGALILYYFLFKNLDLFKKHGIPYLTPLPLIGNMGSIVMRRQGISDLVTSTYNVDPVAKYVGMYDRTTPIIMLRDPELLKLIALKHTDSFMDHRDIVTQDQDNLFGNNLFTLRGDKWRQVRILLTPAFTSSKMKNMFKLMSDCGAQFGNYMAQTEEKSMDMKSAFTRYTSDVIATCAFGVTTNSMRDPDNEFYVYGREATTFNNAMFLKMFIFQNLPWLARLLGLKMIRDKVKIFFHDLVETTIRTRDEKGIVRPDMLQLMMENRGKEDKISLTIDDMVSQAFIFFFGGFDTTSRPTVKRLTKLSIAWNT